MSALTLRGLARPIMGALLHGGIWIAVQWSVIYLASGSPSRVTYGTIAGWWAALYVGYVASVGLRTFPVIAVAIALWVVLTIFGPWRDMYREPGETVTLAVFLYEVGLGSMIYGSPILVNAMVHYSHRLVGRARQRK